MSNTQLAALKMAMTANVVEAKTIVAVADSTNRKLSESERDRAEDLLAEIHTQKRQIERLEAGAVATKTNAIAYDSVTGGDILAEFKAAGWKPGERVTIDNPGIQIKAATFDGDVRDISPVRREGAELGFDVRYIHPAFPTETLSGDTTSVQVMLQSGRTLAAASDVIRDLDETSPKPETASEKTLVTHDLKQVAAVETDTPNVILAQPGFRSMVERDLLVTIREAYDQLVLDAIAGVSPTSTSPGADLVASLRQAIEDLAALGYTGPYTALLSPADAVGLDLLQTSGPEMMYQFGVGQFARAPFGLTVRIGKNVTDPMVTDAAAFGRMYATGLTLATFEQDAGQTNSSTVRLEGHAVFGVEREDALTVIGGS